MRELSSIVLTHEGKYWLAKDTLSGVSSFGKTKKRAYRALAEALALYLDGMRREVRQGGNVVRGSRMSKK